MARIQTPDDARLQRTPGLLLGPYYPLDMPACEQAKLWSGEETPAGARHLRLSGRVCNVFGTAVAGAWVELWHADPSGHYRHPSSPACRQFPDHFTGCGRVRTDREGRFEFATLEPGMYREGEVQRAPHLHVQVTGRFDRLVTQLFLRGHPANAQDHLFRTVRRPELLIPHVECDGPEAIHLHWDAVLSLG